MHSYKQREKERGVRVSDHLLIFDEVKLTMVWESSWSYSDLGYCGEVHAPPAIAHTSCAPPLPPSFNVPILVGHCTRPVGEATMACIPPGRPSALSKISLIADCLPTAYRLLQSDMPA
jgi:hypothetical protein